MSQTQNRDLGAEMPSQAGAFDQRLEQAQQGALQAFQNELHDCSITILRHGEKTTDPNNPDLSPAGYDRAKALGDPNSASYLPKEFGNPDFIFAATDSANSHRPSETVTPLSQATGVPIDTRFNEKDPQALVDEIKNNPQKYDGKNIVIAWRHTNIPALAKDFGAPDGTYPAQWNANDFGNTIDLNFDQNGQLRVSQKPENY